MHTQYPYVRTQNDLTLQPFHREPAAGTYVRSTTPEIPEATLLKRPEVRREVSSDEDHTRAATEDLQSVMARCTGTPDSTLIF